jgi:hypothetical protein
MAATIEANGAPVELMRIDHSLRKDLYPRLDKPAPSRMRPALIASSSRPASRPKSSRSSLAVCYQTLTKSL